jgi:hypothetical protein
MRSLLSWCVRDMEAIARVASRDTGKTREFVVLSRRRELIQACSHPTVVDAAFGEILTTCEKLRWVLAYGEDSLKPESRPYFRFSPAHPLPCSPPHCRTNMILAHKVSKVHYEPLGVVSAIVSWNYPAHSPLRSPRSPAPALTHPPVQTPFPPSLRRSSPAIRLCSSLPRTLPGHRITLSAPSEAVSKCVARILTSFRS